MRLSKNINWFFILSLILLTGLMLYIFLPSSNIFLGHDVTFNYRRFIALMKSLENGMFPLSIDFEANKNYGYAMNFFYPNFTLIPFAIIANFTSYIFAYKFMWFVITILCGTFTYRMINRIFDNPMAATFGSLLYTFSAYRIQDIFERVSLGEALSLTFIPIVFLGLYEIIKGDYKKWYIIAIGFTLIIFTHLISVIITFIGVVIFLLIYNKNLLKEPRRFGYLLISGIVTIILSSYFILPFIEQLQHGEFRISTILPTENIASSSIQLIKNISYPHPISTANSSIHLGISFILCLVLRPFVKDNSNYTKSIDIIGIVGFVLLLLTLNWFDWTKYPLKLINAIQFPWRLYILCSLFFSVSAGYYLSKIVGNKKFVCKIILPFVIGGLLITHSNRNNLILKQFNYKRINIENGIPPVIYNDEYLPKKLGIETILARGNKIDTQNSSTQISNIERNDGFISCDIETSGNEQIEFPLTYYKGYTATLNNEPLEVRESQCGLVEVPINNSGKLVVQFTGTFIQRYSLYISLISILLLSIYIILYNKRNEVR